MPKTFFPVVRIAKYTLMDEVRQRSFIIMLAICALFIFLVRGCYQGSLTVNGQQLDPEAVVRVVSTLNFHVITVGAMLLVALLSMRVLKRDREDGMQSSILSKPIVRWQYVAGKILGLWAISLIFMFILHTIVFVIASLNLNALTPEYLAASLLSSFNLLFVIIAVLLLSLLMSDVFAFLCILGIGIVGVVADTIHTISNSPLAQVMIGVAVPQPGWTWWKVFYFLWPKLSGAERFASSFIGGEGLPEWAALYPLVNIIFYIVILGALLFWRFQSEDII
jgi:hypothetical protein